jgi:hypothetical protein
MTVGTCRGTTKDGKPCSAQARPGSAWCPWHDPELVERRVEWSRQGGKNSSNKARARKRLPEGALSIGEVNAVMGKVLTDLIGGEMEPGVATAASNVARTIDVLTRGVDLEEQIAQLRRDLAAFAERRGTA